MSGVLKNRTSPISGLIAQLRKHLSDRTLIMDLAVKFIITFGVVLIVGGLYLMMPGASVLAQGQTNSASQSAVSTVGWIPGIPFYIGDLVNVSVATVGLVSWIIGVDLLFVGLGLWVRHKLARLTALIIFVLAASFQFLQFLFLGFMGSPTSVIELLINGIFVYLLFSKFDSLSKNPEMVKL